MELRGFSTGGEIVKFKLSDCPVVITERQIALFGKKDSCLLKSNTVGRGYAGIYEGDTIADKETGRELGVVVYAGGFRIHDKAGGLKAIPDAEHIKVIEGGMESAQFAFGLAVKTPILFKYKEEEFGVDSIVTKIGGSLHIALLKEHVNPDSITFYTGYRNTATKKKIFFGDTVDKGRVALHRGSVIIQYPDGSSELAENICNKEG